MRAGCNELSAAWWFWREKDDLSAKVFLLVFARRSMGMIISSSSSFQYVWVWVCMFRCHSSLASPTQRAAAWNWPPEPPSPLCPKGLSDSDRKGMSDPSRDTPRAQAGAEEAAATVPSTGIKPATPSPHPNEVEPLYSQINAQLGTLCKQWQKPYFLGYSGTDHIQLIGTT